MNRPSQLIGTPTRSTDRSPDSVGASVDRSYVRTNERTNEEPPSPSDDISPYVTRTRTYEISADLDQLIATIALACNVRPIPLGTPHEVERDPKWRLHRAQVVAAAQDRDVCSYDRCLRATELDSRWCHRHHPDDVAIIRAMTGERLALMPHERHEAVRRLHSTGHGWNTIQERLGVSGRTIAKALTR